MRHTILAMALLAGGCESSEQQVRRVASIEQGCPLEQIKILVYDPTIHSFRLDVCGKLRVYRWIGHTGYMDVTNGTLPPRAP